MPTIITTERLLLREMLMSDLEDMYEMDSDPEVCKYLCVDPLQNIRQMKEKIQKILGQQKEYGMERWVVEDRQSHELIGCSGLTLEVDSRNFDTPFYELGFRFKRDYWGLGYASEAAGACIDHGLNNLKVNTIFAVVDQRNSASIRVLEKIGMKPIRDLIYHGVPHHRYSINAREVV